MRCLKRWNITWNICLIAIFRLKTSAIVRHAPTQNAWWFFQDLRVNKLCAEIFICEQCVCQSLTRVLKKSCIVYSCISRLCIRVCIFMYLLKIFIFRVCIVYFANFLIVYSRVFNINLNYSIVIFQYCLYNKTVYVYYFCLIYSTVCIQQTNSLTNNKFRCVMCIV